MKPGYYWVVIVDTAKRKGFAKERCIMEFDGCSWYRTGSEMGYRTEELEILGEVCNQVHPVIR